jgi:hypothetical protein
MARRRTECQFSPRSGTSSSTISATGCNARTLAPKTRSGTCLPSVRGCGSHHLSAAILETRSPQCRAIEAGPGCAVSAPRRACRAVDPGPGQDPLGEGVIPGWQLHRGADVQRQTACSLAEAEESLDHGASAAVPENSTLVRRHGKSAHFAVLIEYKDLVRQGLLITVQVAPLQQCDEAATAEVDNVMLRMPGEKVRSNCRPGTRDGMWGRGPRISQSVSRGYAVAGSVDRLAGAG